jgi:hypothetical protein
VFVSPCSTALGRYVASVGITSRRISTDVAPLVVASTPMMLSNSSRSTRKSKLLIYSFPLICIADGLHSLVLTGSFSHKRLTQQKKQRERERKELDALGRRHLANVRVVQRNVVYVVGIGPRFAKEEVSIMA